ncbi:hypothetical protein [Planctomicrobium piriforme]|uniref:Uncharacterized protein n=1 Tax=Planctomicrobium piriforme TaxID=1576369 RepID=A0A1I3P0T6_9PLAN|nr:hypothetical protein [Planctomicrobium piriforme]SFJ15059.1 hypothetical protein SAMN05421753_1162 [Planctomicrobium piriforme]
MEASHSTPPVEVFGEAVITGELVSRSQDEQPEGSAILNAKKKPYPHGQDSRMPRKSDLAYFLPAEGQWTPVIGAN